MTENREKRNKELLAFTGVYYSLGCAYATKHPDTFTGLILAKVGTDCQTYMNELLQSSPEGRDVIRILEDMGKALAEKIGASDVYTKARLASIEWVGIE